MGWTNVPFDIPNHRAENGPAQNHLRIGWLRSVANIHHAFAIHSFVDELAQLAKRDSVEYLLDVLGQARKVDVGQRDPLAAKFPLETGTAAPRDRAGGGTLRLGEEESPRRDARWASPRIGAS